MSMREKEREGRERHKRIKISNLIKFPVWRLWKLVSILRSWQVEEWAGVKQRQLVLKKLSFILSIYRVATT